MRDRDILASDARQTLLRILGSGSTAAQPASGSLALGIKMIATLREAWRRRAIVSHLVQKYLTSSYRTKALGFLWALLDPLLFMGVYYIVFGRIMAHRPLPFMLHIFIGIIAFRFLNTSTTQAAGSLRAQSGLIRNVSFPRTALPMAVVLSRLLDYLAAWVVVAPLCLVFHVPLTWHWLFVPFMILVQTVFVMGLTFLTAYVGVFFADIENILRVGLRLWFYMSPVLYDLDRVRNATVNHPKIYGLYLANPMISFLEAYRSSVLQGKIPVMLHIGYALAVAVIFFVVGLAVFVRAEGQLAKYV